MQIFSIRVGMLATNCYLVEDEGETLVIDPGDDREKILRLLEEKRLKVKFIVNTHGHYDHIGANRFLKERTKAPLLVHQSDVLGYAVVDSPAADRFLVDGDTLPIGNLTFKVIHTPGHTPGGICLYCEKEKNLFSGDTLFLGTYGRVDLPGSSEKEMKQSLTKILALPSEIVVYPGHGKTTTIGAEVGLLREF